MKLTLFCLFAAITAFTYWLRHINLQHLKRYGDTVPEGFDSAIDAEKLRRSSAYTLDSSRLGLWDSLLDNALLIIFLFGGLIATYDRLIGSLSTSPIISAILFFLLLSWVSTLLGIPFDLYGTFRIEARYGFNTTTPRIWIADFLKSQGIGAVLLSFLIAVVFWLISWSPQQWWLWVWGFMALFSLFMMFISPYLIEPLFNRYEPVTEEGLEEEIRVMMEKAGLKVGKVQQMDASKRSNHSNAYFTGIGRVKRIVLYDTLIKQMSHEEIVAVLAHEIGHWKKGHIWKRLLWAEIMALAGSWLGFDTAGVARAAGTAGSPCRYFTPGKNGDTRFCCLTGPVPARTIFRMALTLPRTGGRSFCLGPDREAGRSGLGPGQDVGGESLQPVSAPAVRRVLLFAPADGGAGSDSERVEYHAKRGRINPPPSPLLPRDNQSLVYMTATALALPSPTATQPCGWLES